MLFLIAGAVLLLTTLLDAFETIVLPRRVTRRFRLTRLVYRLTWIPWHGVARHLRNPRRRQNLLGVFGPLSLIVLLGSWAFGLLAAFALLQYGAGSHFLAPDHVVHWTTDLYVSGTTLFTLGLGDIAPAAPVARFLTVLEAGTGFGFFAIVIGYFPVLYQAFSRREAAISLLDARAGSPPSAAELLRRQSVTGDPEVLRQTFADWELWSAELMESHLSYPVLAYYRSQHSNQSWLAALACLLDASALVMSGYGGPCARQAELTFAMARHLLVDLSQVLGRPPLQTFDNRLNLEALADLRDFLAHLELEFQWNQESQRRFDELRALYEPYLHSLAEYLLFPLPAWLPVRKVDNWQATAWNRVRGRTIQD